MIRFSILKSSLLFIKNVKVSIFAVKKLPLIKQLILVRYEIKTSAHKLTEYLRDASPLKVDVIDVNDQVVGTTLVHNLQQVGGLVE